MEWVTVWDLGKLPHQALWRFVEIYWGFLAIPPFCFIAIRLEDRLDHSDARRVWSKLILTIIAWGGLFMMVVTSSHFVYLYMRYATGLYGVAEGTVEKFVPALDRGSAFRFESFIVGDEGFAYHHRLLCPCFNRTALAGGPMREGLYVRISHVGGAILKLEIREQRSDVRGQ